MREGVNGAAIPAGQSGGLPLPLKLLKPFHAVGLFLPQIVAELRKVVSPAGGWAGACAVFMGFLMLLLTSSSA